MTTLDWSEEIPFDESIIGNKVPRDAAGVYEFLQSEEYPRYQGSTRVLKIGMSKTDLRKEIMNHFQRHTVANRLDRIRNIPKIKVSVKFAVVAVENATKIEDNLLREFEDKHWDLPVLNSQRGYSRGEDKHYRTKKQQKNASYILE